MGRIAVITLEGPASFSESGRPSFKRGIPMVTTKEDVIQWAESVGFLKVVITKNESVEPIESKAEAVKPVEPAPELKKKKPMSKVVVKGSGTKSKSRASKRKKIS